MVKFLRSFNLLYKYQFSYHYSLNIFIKYLELFKYYLGLPGTLPSPIPPSLPQKKKIHPEKNSLFFRRWNFLSLTLKTCSYFLKRKLFLYFLKWKLNETLHFSPKAQKIKKIHLRKFLLLQEMKTLEMLSPKKAFLLFQERETLKWKL